MKKYYWILVDTLAKTLEIVESASCQAATEEQIAKSKFNIDKMNGLQRTQFSNRFRMIFNDTSDKIDLNNVYKAASRKINTYLMEETTMTIREATNLWVNRDMSAIPLSVVEKLAKCSDYNDLMEVTPPAINDRVYVFDNGEYGEITNYTTNDDGNGIYTIILDNDEEITTTDVNDFEVQRDEYFPMWGTMWSFDDNCDVRWLEDNMQIMANCGFRIYESEDYGYIFGIDGAGYDFYEAHWIPLYKARGMRWHDNEEGIKT